MVGLALLLFLDYWLAATIVNATTGTERGEGSVFWTTIVLIALVLAALVLLTARLVRGVVGLARDSQ